MAATLTYKELELLQNAEVFFLKNSIIEKVYQVFGEVSKKFDAIAKEATNIPQQAFLQSPKISKGENYLGLPWVMLDYFRAFDKENSFAIRCFFWWGNSFSFHVYASGHVQATMLQNLCKLKGSWYGCINKSPWLHEFTKYNYLPLHEAMQTYKNNIPSFIKIGCYIPIIEWNKAPFFYNNAFTQSLELL